MIEEKRDRGQILDDIIEIELGMFQGVNTVEPSLCQQRPETFKVMREMTHSVLSTETLESYLEDLRKAKAEGRNLPTEKYARMQNLIPPLKVDEAIKDIMANIVRTESRWVKEASDKYPHCLVDQGAGFGTYLNSELETYSDKTLKLYFADVSEAEKEGRNLAEERYNRLAEILRYGSIEDMEKTMAQRKQ